MDEMKFLREQRERARQALRESVDESKSWVKSGRIARQTVRHFPGASIAVAVTGGVLVGRGIARRHRAPAAAETAKPTASKPSRRAAFLRAAKAGAWSLVGILRAVAEANKSSTRPPG